MKAKLVPSVSHARRACGKNSGMVVRGWKNGAVDVYEKPALNNPNTQEQKLTRALRAEGMRDWRELPAEAKAGWNSFAARKGRAFPRESAEPLTGYRLFLMSAFNRKLLGLAPREKAPGMTPPPAPTRAELLPSAEADTLRLRVEHTLKGWGFSVVVSMTPATIRRGRRGYRNHARYVKGINSSSTAPLPVSGGEITFTNCRFSIAPGKRFGVWIRILRHSDGLSSPELALDFYRPDGGDE